MPCPISGPLAEAHPYVPSPAISDVSQAPLQISPFEGLLPKGDHLPSLLPLSVPLSFEPVTALLLCPFGYATVSSYSIKH